MKNYKTLISNFFWMIHDSIDKIRESILHCLAVFLIWFSITS